MHGHLLSTYKMKATIVQFMAFDRPQMMVFLQKGPEEIHQKLSQLCKTYHPTSIIQCDNAEHLPLTVLTDLIKKDESLPNK